MTVQVNYIDGGIGVEVIATGVVAGDEVIEAYNKIYAPDRLSKQKYQLIDRMQCEKYFLSAGDLKTIADLDKAAAEVNSHIIIAITSPSELMQQAAEIWKSYVKSSHFVTELFTDRASAIAWIEAQLGEKIPLS